MRLSKRIQKLERALGVTGPCAVCGGAGVALAVNGVDLSTAHPTGCPSCGKARV